MGQCLFVDFGGCSACGVVYQHAVFQIHVYDCLNESFRRARGLGSLELGLPIAFDARLGEEHLAAVGHAHDAEVQAARIAQVIALGEDLIDHRSAHVADAEAEDVQCLDFGFEEGLVHRLQGLAFVLGVDDDGDVALSGALRNGADADAVAAEGGEGAPGDAALLAHAVAHKRHDGKAGFDHEGADAAELLVGTKLFVEGLLGAVGVVVCHGDGDGVLAGPLGDQHDIDPGEGQGGKEPAGKAGHTHHAAATDGDEGDVFEGAQSGHAAVGQWGVGAPVLWQDLGAGAFRVVRQADVHGNVFLRKLGHGGRKDHFGTEVAELHGLGVAEFIDDAGRGHDTRIGRHHARYIRPLFKHSGVEEASGVGGTEVASSPAECRGRPVGCAADEAFHEEEVTVVEPGVGKAVAGGVHIEAG